MDADFEITEFMDEGVGFDCVFKQRFQDFIVREIDPFGNLVTLTDIEAPEHPTAKCQAATLESVFDADTAQLLSQLGDGQLSEVKIVCNEKSKDERARMHKCIREFFDSKLESSTVNQQNETAIIVRRTDLSAKGNCRKRKLWPHQQLGDYCCFVLYKENKDTQAAVASLAKKLHIKPGQIAVAGNKDRRAVTSQLASVYRIEAAQLTSLNGCLRSVKVGNCSYVKNSVFLGNLSGNHFSIVLRNVVGDKSVVSSCVERLEHRGFINYYGAQRFGTSNTPTYKVGRCILLKQWEQAVCLILAPKGRTDDDLEAARLEWAESKSATAALEKLSHRLRSTTVEGMLLTSLKKAPKGNYVVALKAIPRNMLNMYVHSYQSLLWNRLVSRRIQRFGVRTLQGDLIRKTGAAADEVSVVNADMVDDVSIYDLCLPIFAEKAQLPANECGKLYEEILREENLEPANFGALSKQFSIHGGFRKLFVRPADMEHRFVGYDDPTVPLVPTDLDLLEGRQPAEPTGEKFLALIIEFSLPAGCYATMALRELCRIDMSKKAQSMRNEYSQIHE
uniref:TRUD domain-containing protein n=1 Tax=Trichuris muris TaxID=70415 RepID=A0A5S6QW68_TRIMR